MAELVYYKSPCKCSCLVFCFVCVLVSFCVCINDLASNQTRKTKQSFHSVFPLFFFYSFKSLLLLFFCCCFTSPFVGFDTSSIVRKHPRNPTVTKTNTIAQFHFHRRGGGLQRGMKGFRGKKVFKSINNLRTQGSSSQSAAGCVHTYHSYIISIIWHRKASKLTER